MEVITIGRDTGNRIIIDDNFVGRKHLEITVDNNGIIRLTDLGSTNGTYVNGKRIKGEIYLNETDIVRIGNTTLPWKKYISNDSNIITSTNPDIPADKRKKKVKKPINWRNILSIVTTIMSLLLMIFMLLRYLK